MPDTLDHLLDRRVVRSLGAELAAADPRIDPKRFVRDASTGLDELGLMARGAHVATAMKRHLDASFPEAARTLVASLDHRLPESEDQSSFRYLPHTSFVAAYGLEHLEESLAAQHALTKRFTAEFSLRPFLVAHPEATFARLVQWTTDPDPHVRRLVSEGTRPRLPWAPRLRMYQLDPRPGLALLERLRDDPELYVRRSVANHLNDIAKDHPEEAIEVCRRWMIDAPPDRRWIVRHALRTLVKRGDQEALAILGFGASASVRIENVRLEPKRVRLGEEFRFSAEIVSTAPRAAELLVDFRVGFVKADGTRKPKTFKGTKLVLEPGGAGEVRGRVSFAPMTTRISYPGRHTLALVVNGAETEIAEFEVVR